MSFISLEFAIFMPLVFILYWHVFKKNSKRQNFLILVANGFFYAVWDWRFLFLLAFSTLSTFGIAKHIESQIKKDNRKNAKWLSFYNIIIQTGLLIVFKYFNFFVESVKEAFLFCGHQFETSSLNIILPLGISFYTLKAISYSIDVYKQKIQHCDDILTFSVYLTFFPQIIAGPIERASDMLPQLKIKRIFSYEMTIDGLRQILWGLLKKIVIADNCALMVNNIFETSNTQTGSTLLIGAILFSFQIYGDFSGYSDISIGIAKILGIKTQKNFDFPYFARNIAEFWKKWHISLTSWFKDYIYIPLGGSRYSKSKTLLNTFAVFLLSGLWHGANWTFIAWGLFHALCFVFIVFGMSKRKYYKKVAENTNLPSFKEFWQMATTFIIVTFGWIIFKADSISHALTYISKIFSQSLFTIPTNGRAFLAYFILIAICVAVEWIQRKKRHGLDFTNTKITKHTTLRFALYYAIILVILIFTSKEQQFIYAQF